MFLIPVECPDCMCQWDVEADEAYDDEKVHNCPDCPAKLVIPPTVILLFAESGPS